MTNNSGRRKAAVARVYLKEGKGQITVNKKPIDQYFPLEWHRNSIVAPLSLTENAQNYDIMVNVRGGVFQDKQRRFVWVFQKHW